MVLPGDSADLTPGKVPDPRALPIPAGFVPCGDAADLFLRSESAWGDAPIIGTEPLAVSVFNRGYGLTEVRLRIRAFDAGGRVLADLEREIAELPRGTTTVVEIPSYELPHPATRVEASLVSAEFQPAD